MAQKLKFGNGTWATKEGSTLAYNDENNNYKPLPFTTTRNSIATRVNKEGLIEVVGNDVPRIDYTDSADGVLLLENSATNYVKHSESIDSWSTGFPSLSPNAVTADYEQGAYSNTVADRIQLTVNSSNTVSQVYQVLPITSGECTASVWLKSLSGTPTISIIDGYNTVGSFKLVTLTNEWVRHTLTFTATASDFIPQFLLLNGTTSSSADFLAYGFQVENGSVASSYIPTSGSTVTRQADTANGSGNSEVFNDSEGSLYMDFDVIEKTSSSYYIVSVRSSNGSDVLGVGGRQGKAFAEMFDGTNYISNNSANLVDGKNKIFLTYNSGNSAKLFLNGIKVLDFTGTIPTLSNLSELTQGDRFLGNKYYGNISEIGYYDEILTDLELEYLTSYRSLNELVTALNLNTL